VIGNLLADSEPYIRAITTVLIHSLWQGILVGILSAFVLAILRDTSTRLRYALSCCAMLAVVAAAAVTALVIWPDTPGTLRYTSSMSEQAVGTESRHNAGLSDGIDGVDDPAVLIHHWWSDSSVSRCVFLIWVAGVIVFSTYHLLLVVLADSQRGASPHARVAGATERAARRVGDREACEAAS